MKAKDLKDLVKEKYGEIAAKSEMADESGCCGPSCSSAPDYTIFSDDYSTMEGYNPDADLQLGCGMPTEFANISKGNSVLDLGSGAGNDCFIARAITGETGSVAGLDFTDEMIKKANENLRKTGFDNVEFIKGDIENMPFEAARFDVVVSNCVLNLVPDKKKAFSEIYRVLKPGGHFCISDVVVEGSLPDDLREAAEMYAGCVAGAITQEAYLNIIKETGFAGISVHTEKPIILPDDILLKYLNNTELVKYKESDTAIQSITVSGKK